MSIITNLLQSAAAGDRQATFGLLPFVYDELRRIAKSQLAREAPGQTLQPTALVHEAYLRMVGPQGEGPHWENRRHFFAAAAEAMRRILVDSARRKESLKRGGDLVREAIEPDQITSPEIREDLLALDDALNRLSSVDPEACQLVHLRYFAGLTLAEAADALKISPRTADRLWAYARSWLRQAIEEGE